MLQQLCAVRKKPQCTTSPQRDHKSLHQKQTGCSCLFPHHVFTGSFPDNELFSGRTSDSVKEIDFERSTTQFSVALLDKIVGVFGGLVWFWFGVFFLFNYFSSFFSPFCSVGNSKFCVLAVYQHDSFLITKFLFTKMKKILCEAETSSLQYTTLQ